MAFFIASIFASTSLDSNACLISLAMAGVALWKWMRRLQDFSMDDCRDGDVAGGSREEGKGRSGRRRFRGRKERKWRSGDPKNRTEQNRSDCSGDEGGRTGRPYKGLHCIQVGSD